MSSHITTDLLMLGYTGTPNLVAEVLGANPTATTFVLDCETPKNKKSWAEDECWMTQYTVVVGPWAEKTPAPGAVTTGIYRESQVDDDEEWGFSFSMECQMDQTMPKVCTTTNLASFSDERERTPTATYTKHGGTTFDGFFYYGYGYFDWTPVTVTAGQKYLLAAKTAASTEATATGDVSGTAKVVVATTAQAGTTRTSSVDEDLVTVTGEATTTQTSSSGACTRRVLSFWVAVGLATCMALF
ncbi:hypothetical protein FBEOM_12897 [Fusarium beomiforme]|uniref:Uncharacterized protein n=1 Tax=Fusarium beomiforme TaxID=44412 RepID=A0A9P5DPS2_9HYPO|nr:hypothetical protein FBEOM_12897 [Fusarium beomiforme]